MAAKRDQPPIPDERSPEAAHNYLIRFLGRQDLDEHEAIYDELAIE